MSIFNILIFFAIGYMGYKLFIKSKSKNTDSDTMTDGSPLTDTQINWRRQQAEMAKENPELYDPNYDPRNTSSSLRTINRQSSLAEVQQYIKENKRKFKFLEWLFWDMDPRFIRRYVINVGIFLAIWFGPMLFGVDASVGFAFIVLIILDLVLYSQQRVLEITTWDPEFVKLFDMKK